MTQEIETAGTGVPDRGDPPVSRIAAVAGRAGRGVLRALYPPQCLTCDVLVAEDFGLCPECWSKTPFIFGLACDACGAPVPGEEGEGPPPLCEECHAHPRPWSQGRAAMLYRDNARRLVLALKHGDRLDCAGPAGRWMERAAAPVLRPGMLVAPVPLHWRRMFRRRTNQAALLARAVARAAGLEHCPDLLVRPRSTGSQEGRTGPERFENLAGALALHPRRGALVAGRDVLLVDDVMTSGATLSAGTAALLAGGAATVSVLVLARVAKDR